LKPPKWTTLRLEESYTIAALQRGSGSIANFGRFQTFAVQS